MQNIQIISAPSILGLKPGGVEHLGKSLLATGLAENLHAANSIIHVPHLNSLYSLDRDKKTGCLNPIHLKDFSLTLIDHVSGVADRNTFPLVLGGDCSILLGIMPALKRKGIYGLVFVDAHADFYEPEKSPTGEVADMDLAIVTGRGPDILTNILGLKPYVKDEHVIHVGQRDAEETKKYHSRDIKDTPIKQADLDLIRTAGLKAVLQEILQHIDNLKIDGFWIHFDTDVLADHENPAVDYRLPGGLLLEEAELLLNKLIHNKKATGMSVTIFNPDLDPGGIIAKKISDCLAHAFN